jgi:predicted secreted protein
LVRAWVFGLALLALPRLGAAEGTVRAEVDARKIGVGDQLQLTVSVQGAGFRLMEDVALPRLQNLRVVAGPSLSTQVSLVNGAMSQSRTSTWILQPVAVGKAEIGAVKARFEDGEKATEPIAIDVVAGSIRPRAEQQAPDPFGEDPFEALRGQRRARARDPKLFVEAAVSRARLHVGEPLLLTYWLYTQVSVSDLQFVDAPQYPGFWAEDLEKPPTPPQGEGASVAGETYRRFPIFVKLLFPTKSGRLVIPATNLRLGLPRQSFFDSGGVVQRTTKELAVTVDPIPETPGFSGAVGRFRVTAVVDKPTLALGEAATLRFKVEGTGNLKWIDKAPEVAVPGAKVYPPQVKSDLKPSATGLSGSRTWEFVVVPETTGNLEVPALNFSFFDVGAGRVENATTAPLAMRVEGGTAAAGLPLPAPAALPSRKGAPLPLRNDLEGPARGSDWGPTVLGSALAVTLAAHGLLFGLGRFGRKTRGGAGAASRRSVRAALSELDRVGRDGLTKEAAATLIERALVEAFGPLDDKDAETTEGASAARSLLEEVHFVRYAPQLGDYSEKLRDLAARATATVKRWA